LTARFFPHPRNYQSCAPSNQQRQQSSATRSEEEIQRLVGPHRAKAGKSAVHDFHQGGFGQLLSQPLGR
jgi:hypothetical protein